MAIEQWDDLLRVTEGFKQIQELCRHRSITTTFNVYGLFDSLHERLADRLEEPSRCHGRDDAGRRLDQRRRVGRVGIRERLLTSVFALWAGQDSNPRHEG